MTLALLLLAVLVLAVAGAAWYHLRTLESYYDNMLAYQAKQIESLREDLEQERSERKQTEDAQAQWCLLLAERLSDIETRPQARQPVLFAPPRDRN